MKKILVIDDEKNIRMTLSVYLESEGFEVVTAMNGEEGLKKYAEKDFDVVLLDMKLPGKNGIEVLREMKEKHNKDATIIMITGYSSVESAVETMKLGAVDYLQKPFTPEEIGKVVNEVIKRRELSKEEGQLKSVDEFLAFAKKSIHDRKFDIAKKVLNKAVSLDDKRAEVFNLLGVISELEQKQPEAMKYYRTALALDPSYRPAQQNLERASQLLSYSVDEIKLDEEEGES